MENVFAAERLARYRRIGIMLCASAFLIWQIPLLDYSDRLSSQASIVATGISLVGFLTWLVLLLLLSKFYFVNRNSGLTAVLNDELTRSNRARAFAVGYIAMISCAAGLFALSLFIPVSGVEATHLVLAIGVAAPLYAFAAFERTGENE